MTDMPSFIAPGEHPGLSRTADTMSADLPAPINAQPERHDFAANPYVDWHDAAPEHDQEHEAAVPAAPPPPPPDAPPQPLFAGTYAVYDDGAKGVVLVLAQKGGETVHKHIPAGLLKMAERFGGGGLSGLFGGA